MSDYYKPRGGNKPQPYIPASNGDKSGQYTNKVRNNKTQQSIKNCYIKNVPKKFNFYRSKLIKTVNNYYHYNKGQHVQIKFTPNTVIKK